MALPNNRLMDTTEIKQKITAGDLKQKSGSTLPADSPLCPDFDTMDDYVDLDTTTFINSGYSLARCATLGKLEFQDFVILSGWDMNFGQLAYSGNSFYVGSQEASPTGIAFNDDGTKFYVTGYATRNVNQYSLTTPYDITTISYVKNFNPNLNPLKTVNFNSDGSKMYLHDGTSIYEYNLSTSWEIDSAVLSLTHTGILGSENLNSIKFSADGDKIIGLCDPGVNESLYSYTLSTPWDISTTVKDITSVDLNAFNIPNAYALGISPDGKHIYAGGYNTNPAAGTINSFDLSTPWDLSSATYNTSFDTSSQSVYSAGICFNDTGSKMFVSAFGQKTVYEYSV